MLVLHIPCLANYNDTVGNSYSSISGTAPTYPADATSPLTRSLSIAGTAATTINYTPRMHGTTKMSVAFWYKCSGVNNTTTSYQKIISLYTLKSKDVGQDFRLERTSTGSTRYVIFNNGNFTGSGGFGAIDMTDGEWYHIVISADTDTSDWNIWLTPLSTLVTSHTSGKAASSTQCYFTDKFYIQKVAAVSGAQYSDIRVYDHLISEYEVHELLKRPICHLNFNFPSGKVRSTVTDLTGMGNNATSTSATSSIKIGDNSILGDTCAHFEGAQSLTLPDTCKIMGNFTVSWWYYRTDTYGNSNILTSNQDPISCGPNGANGWRTYTRDATNLYFQDNGTNRNCGFAVNSLPVNQWHLFAFAFDFNAKNVKLYVDGVLKSTTTLARTSMTYGTTALTVGSYAGGNYLKADLDDLRIYASALSADDISQLYKQRLNIDNKLHCKSSLFEEAKAESSASDNLFESGQSLKQTTNGRLTATRTTEESFTGNNSIKVVGGLLPKTHNLTAWTNIKVNYMANSDVYTLSGTTNAAGGASQFLWVDLSSVSLVAGKTVTCTLEWIGGTVSLSTPNGAAYACPVMDIGTAIGTNVATRHWVDLGSYPTSTTPKVTKSITLTAADVATMKGVRVWMHTRGASTTYGATTATFNNYYFRIIVDYNSGVLDSNIQVQDVPWLQNHKYYVSCRVKSNLACSSQVYLGAWESCPIGTSLTADDQWHLYSGITNDNWTKNYKADTGRYLRFDFDITKYSTSPPTCYWDDIKIIDLTEMYGSTIPSKAECDAKFNGVITAAAQENKVSLINSKSVLSPNSISELGMPMRYIKIYAAGSNKNNANHIVLLEATTTDGTKLILADATNSDHSKIIRGYSSYAPSTTYPYFNVSPESVIDIGSIQNVAAIRLGRYYSDNRYYYQTKISASVDNRTYFVIWDSHNTGSYVADGSKDDAYNTYAETVLGRIFSVNPDKIYIDTEGKMIVGQIIEG